MCNDVITLMSIAQVERLQAVLAGDVEAYFEPRHVIDVLMEFSAARLPLPEVCADAASGFRS